MEPIALTRLQLQRFGGIPELDLAFSPPEPGRGQWTVLIGENGSGKTTILRALAGLTLEIWHVAQTHLVRLANRSAQDGHATIDTSIGQRYYNVEAPNSGMTKVVIHGLIPCQTLAYGCRRGGALGGPERDVDLAASGIDSLFNPNARLIHAETWLRNREHAALKAGGGPARAFFDSVVETLLHLLPGIDALEVGSDDVMVSGPAVGTCSLRELPDGYLTTLGWTVDFIARWSHANPELVDGDFRGRMHALVLVDEIDLHLHPRWQRRVIEAIRTTFPVTSFVVTTHNPLTIQGARPGEVHVLERREDGTVNARQVDPPLGADVDDLLTGPWFGLSTTYDQDTVEKLQQHAQLLRNGVSQRDPARKALEVELRDRLSSFADTEADRELLERAAADGLEGLAGKMSRFMAAKR